VTDPDEAQPWNIRRAISADLVSVRDLIIEVAPPIFRHAGSSADIDRWLSTNADPEKIRRRLESAQSIVLIAFIGDSAVGTGYLDIRHAGEARFGYIGGLYCTLRGKGLGTAFMDTLSDHARAAGCCRLQLTVGADNYAMLAMVRSRGFTEV
jgi:RimJ/RimL family protein N-acetyltransferase